MALDDFSKRLDRYGRLPSIKLEVTPLQGKPFTIERFNSYSFSSNILVPVDAFSFVFKPALPTSSANTWDKLIREGDVVQLTVGGEPLSTGFCDTPDINTSNDGSIISVNGRDVIGYLESNDSVNPDSSILWTNFAKIGDVLPKLIENTRIQGFETRNMPDDVGTYFATTPGESKLASLQRFIDPLNAIVWASPTGKLVCGRPAFSDAPKGTLGMRIMGNVDGRLGNVLNMSIHRASGQIPNAILVVWTGNESNQVVNKSSLKLNAAEGPSRLYNAGHKLYRCIPVSAPDANNVQSGLPELSRLVAQGANYFGALAAREFARENVNELVVTCSVLGHINAAGEPYRVDTTYNIVHDAAGLDEKMYLYSVDYELSEDGSQVSHLAFCKLGCIVADSNMITSVTGTGTGNTLA